MQKKVDIAKIKQLREETDVSYAICRQALIEANGDLQQARKILIQQGAKKIEKAKSNETSEGKIFAYVHHNGKFAGFVELLSQTDFVANSQEFLDLGKNLAQQAASIDFKTTEEFLNQEFIKDPKKKVQDLINDAILKLGENIRLSRAQRWVLGELQTKNE
ncbi:MAG: hypothetical protein KatS3mg090_0398 [Patescibacteria group bacterium]|nr:MAG: hypothetical protein KatS3mg090_0398 [Patescibacteria group bacterium]